MLQGPISMRFSLLQGPISTRFSPLRGQQSVSISLNFFQLGSHIHDVAVELLLAPPRTKSNLAPASVDANVEPPANGPSFSAPAPEKATSSVLESKVLLDTGGGGGGGNSSGGENVNACCILADDIAAGACCGCVSCRRHSC